MSNAKEATARVLQEEAPMSNKDAVRKVLDAVKAEKRTSLTAPEGKLVCDAYGIPVPKEGVAKSAAEAGKLASGMKDQLCVYEIANGKELHCQSTGRFGDNFEMFANPYNYAQQLMKHGSENIRRKRWIRALAFSPDGQYLAASMDSGIFLLEAKTGKFERDVAIAAWGGATKEEDEDLQSIASTSNVHNLVFSSDGQLLAGVGPNWRGVWGDLHPSSML